MGIWECIAEHPDIDEDQEKSSFEDWVGVIQMIGRYRVFYLKDQLIEITCPGEESWHTQGSEMSPMWLEQSNSI